MFSIDPAILKRYGDIARLLWKYGRADLVTQSGLDRALDGEEPLIQAHDNVNPNDLADDLERLGPTFVKLGQLLSTRADLLPSDYLESLSRLQDRVGPVPFDTIRQLLKDEYGFNPSKIFASIDERPMAAASLGQVHRAVLHDGMEVAVKVQRPDIKEEIDRDLRALMDTAQTLDQHTDAGKQFQFGRIVESLRHTLYRELDYLQEMENSRALGQALKDFHRIRVPQPISDYCTKRVLVMAANSPAKSADRQMLDELHQWMVEHPQLKPAPVIVCLTHIDLLSPVMEWDPPYNWREPESKKEHSIHEAVEYAESLFPDFSPTVVPVCSDIARGRTAHIVDELVPALMSNLSEGQMASLLRTYHQELRSGQVRTVLKQLKRGGRQMLKTWVEERLKPDQERAASDATVRE